MPLLLFHHAPGTAESWPNLPLSRLSDANRRITLAKSTPRRRHLRTRARTDLRRRLVLGNQLPEGHRHVIAHVN